MRRDIICFDVFHLRSAVTKILLNDSKYFIRSQSVEMTENFKGIVQTFLGDYDVRIWPLNKTLSNFIERKITNFIQSIPDVVKWIHFHFEMANFF